MTNKKEVFNKKELIGEKVHCAVFGNGVIHSFLSGIVDELVLVRFFNNGNEVTYYYDGTRNKGENPTLSFGHKEDVEFDYGVPSVKVGDVRLNTHRFGKVALSFNNPDDGQFVYAIKSCLAIKEHGDNSIDEKKLIFKDWLDNQGINAELFWKNCKRKYNWFDCKRKNLINSSSYNWVDGAFFLEKTLLDLSDRDLRALSGKWVREVSLAKNNGIKIEFGFGGK